MNSVIYIYQSGEKMGIELSKESFIKKNQKSTKYITIILIGMLILIVVFPSSNKNEKSTGSNQRK